MKPSRAEIEAKPCDFCGDRVDGAVAMYLNSAGSVATCVRCVLVSERILVKWGYLSEELVVYEDADGNPLNESKR